MRNAGLLNAGYIDDSFLTRDSVDDCRANVIDAIELSVASAFVVHPIKSVFEPTQTLSYLRFILNSVNRTVYLTPEKADKISKACAGVLRKNSRSIRDVAELVGQMVGSFPGVDHGKLYYRALDNDKSRALTQSKGDFDATMILSERAKQDLTWWTENIYNAYIYI